MGQLCVYVDQHSVGGGSLAAVAGHRIAVVEMRMFVDIEMGAPPGVLPNLEVTVGVDLFDGSELAVGNVLVAARRGEMHAVTGRKVAFRFPGDTHSVQPVRVIGEMTNPPLPTDRTVGGS